MSKIQLIHGDCMEGMKTYPDKFFELAIVDPPYGINMGKIGRVGNHSPFGGKNGFKHGVGLGVVPATIYKPFNDSKTPDKEYFDELFRVSKNQIVWGGNYFIKYLTNTPCCIIWDKVKSGFFADAEIAWTSFDSAVRIFKFKWNGMLQENMKDKEKRIHPTQKPKHLYKWILTNYAKEGDKILDTHLGSGSSAIAAHELGFDFTGYEIDKDYYDAALKRFKLLTAQTQLFKTTI